MNTTDDLLTNYECVIDYQDTSNIAAEIIKKHRGQQKNKDEVAKRLQTFPKTRYYGSKKRLLWWIYNNVQKLDFQTVLDGFGGTGSVSLLFKAMGKEVTYHDALRSNSVSANALLSNDFPIANIERAYDFIDSIKGKKGFISKTFSGMYYTDDENAWLDGAIDKINRHPCEATQRVLYYCLFQACLKKRPFNLFHRANLSLRLNNNVSRNFGNLTTWNSPFSKFMKESLTEVRNTVWNSDVSSKVLEPGDVFNVAPGHDLVYFDPPYVDLTNRNDDYLKRYHFLEGLCQYKKWPILIDWETPNFALKSEEYIRAWQKKSVIKELMFELINKHRHSIVVLSYLANVYPSRDELLSYFKSKFKKVSISSHMLSHALAKEEKTEILIIGVPR